MPHLIVVVHQFSGQNAEEMRKCYVEFCSRHLKSVKLYKELLGRDKKFQHFIRVSVRRKIVKLEQNSKDTCDYCYICIKCNIWLICRVILSSESAGVLYFGGMEFKSAFYSSLSASLNIPCSSSAYWTTLKVWLV